MTWPDWFTEPDRIYELAQLVPDKWSDGGCALTGPDIDQDVYPMARCPHCKSYEVGEIMWRGHEYMISVRETQ